MGQCARARHPSSLPGRYVAMLVKLAGIKGTRHGGSICEQLLNVAMRVERCAQCAAMGRLCLTPSGGFVCVCVCACVCLCVSVCVCVCLCLCSRACAQRAPVCGCGAVAHALRCIDRVRCPWLRV